MKSISCWLQSSMERVFPKSPAQNRRSVKLVAARNDRLSFQVCARNENPEGEVKIEVSVSGSDDLSILVRQVGYVSQRHLNTGVPVDELDGWQHVPGYVPEPLYPETSVVVGPGETQAFWVTIVTPTDIQPGVRDLKACVKIGDKTERILNVAIDVKAFTIGPNKDLLVGHWFYGDSLCDWYKLQPYEKKFWDILNLYMADYLGHENNTMFVPHLTPPINGEHRPQQLLKVEELSPGKYRFDLSLIRRWVRMAKSLGATHFLWSHLFTQWGAKHPPRVYLSMDNPESLLWPKDIDATDEVYRNFLKQYLPKLHQFLRSEGLVENSFMQISDEPYTEEHLASYRKGQAMARESAPWIQTMDGLSDVRFYKEGLCNMPISGLGEAHKFAAEKIPHCVYYCCGPRGRWLNRLFDTPLIKIRMTGWLLYRLRASGFMHWGYNYWYKGCTAELLDPFLEQAWGGWSFIPYGDPFVVYPGANGPLDSIRWEIFAESIRDHTLLQTAGISPDDKLLKQIESYEVFPKTEAWLRNTRNKIIAEGLAT